MVHTVRNGTVHASAAPLGADWLHKSQARTANTGDAGDALQNLPGGAGARCQLRPLQRWRPNRQSLPRSARLHDAVSCEGSSDAVHQCTPRRKF